MMLKRRKKYLNTHACTANWCTDALRLVTLQPIFSCRALNSPRRDGEPLAQQNREWRSETDRQNRTGYSLSPLPLKSLFFFFFFYVLEIRRVKKTKQFCECLLSWQIQNDISQKKTPNPAYFFYLNIHHCSHSAQPVFGHVLFSFLCKQYLLWL